MQIQALAPADRIALRLPVIMLVLAAIAIPVELRPLGLATLGFSIQASDVVANIAGFVPVGIVLGELGFLRAVIGAALLSTFAETCQLMMVHRDPSVIDVASNIIGGNLGAALSAHWRIRSPELRINKWRAVAAATMAFGLVAGVWATSGAALSARGITSPGTLEASWKFDESRGPAALDSSGHGLNGRFINEPKRVGGMLGGAVKLDGAKDYIDFDHPTELRLGGSMTISAWINSASFPADDAAIVSHLHGFGYQLDTTVDRGPRTIGFKLTNACGDTMARYGATPLTANEWYHVAGVYDAEAQALDVYLNGKLDNGFLLGPVTHTQQSSARATLYVGRRSDLEGYEFAGSIDDVRIYSLALMKSEIAEDMRGGAINRMSVRSGKEGGVSDRSGAYPGEQCASREVLSEPEDARIPGAAAMFGALVGVACVGLWPSAGTLCYLVMSFAAGLLLLPVAPTTLPPGSLYTMPLVSLAGSASVAMSVRHKDS